MLTYEHGNREGTGSCLVVDLSEAGKGARRVLFQINRQSNDETFAVKGRRRWEFDDPNPPFAALGATQVAHVLVVLKGAAPSILQNKGLVLRGETRTSQIHFDAVEEPFKGFAVHITTTYANGESAEGRIVLSPTEGLALRTALENSMGRLAFG